MILEAKKKSFLRDLLTSKDDKVIALRAILFSSIYSMTQTKQHFPDIVIDSPSERGPLSLDTKYQKQKGYGPS